MTELGGLVDAVAAAIRQASYDFWYEKQTLGCDTRGEDEAAYVAAAVIEKASWDLLMAIVERHYPEDVFPTMEDREDRDLGPRVVSLIRRLNQSVVRGTTQ